MQLKKNSIQNVSVPFLYFEDFQSCLGIYQLNQVIALLCWEDYIAFKDRTLTI